jgi:hypothetical protein
MLFSDYMLLSYNLIITNWPSKCADVVLDCPHSSRYSRMVIDAPAGR